MRNTKSKSPNFVSSMLNNKKAYGYDVGGEVVDNGPRNIHDITLLDTQPNPQEGTKSLSTMTLEPKTKLYAPTTPLLWSQHLEDIWVTTDKETAKRKAQNLAEAEYEGGTPAIAVIAFGNLEGVELKPDPEYALLYREKTWQDSYRSRKSFVLSGDTDDTKQKFTLITLD